MHYKILLTLTLIICISYTQASESSTSLEKNASPDFSHADNERLFSAVEVFGSYQHPSDSKTLAQNILENNKLSDGTRGWNEVAFLPTKIIGTLIMKDHPMVSFIMNRVITVKTFEGHTKAINSAVLNGSEDKVLTASYDKTAKIWNALTGNCLVSLEGHTSAVCSALFNGAEDKVLTASYDSTAKIWDAQTGQFITTLTGHTSYVNSAVFNGSGDKVLTASGDKTAKIWHPQTGKCLVTLEGHTGDVNSAVFNRTEDKILTPSDDATAKIWNAQTGDCLVTLTGHDDAIYSAKFNRAEDKVLTASEDKTAKIWDAHTGNCLVTLKGHDDLVFSAVFNGAEDKVLTASGDRTAKIWDAHTGTCLVTLKGHDSSSYSVVFSGSGDKTVFSGSGDKVLTASLDKTAKIWNAQTGNCLVTLTGHDDRVTSAVFNGAEDKVLAASRDKTAKIWDISILNFFSQDETIKKRVSLNQALILDAIYETIICMRLANKNSAKFFGHEEGCQQVNNIPVSQIIKNMRFDFTTYPHLQKDYEDLPEAIQIILDPYVKKINQDNEASTSSTITGQL